MIEETMLIFFMIASAILIGLIAAKFIWRVEARINKRRGR